MESLPDEIRDEAEAAVAGLLPPKSSTLYEKECQLFTAWKTENNVSENSEEALLAYFSIKSRKYKSSSLWAQYSMLKATLNLHDNVYLAKYYKLTAFLKRQHVGLEARKSSVFEKEQVKKFLTEAADDTFLLIKVVTVIAIAGGCRCDELVKMCVEDVEDTNDILLVFLHCTKTHKKRSFTILRVGFGIDPIDLYRKYIKLRPKQVSSRRLFLNYRQGRCTVQPVGINSFGNMPTKIAKFLKLENPENYTGHAFRRSAATFLADCGADIRTLKRFGGWKSDQVAEGYVEDSLNEKVKIGRQILGESFANTRFTSSSISTSSTSHSSCSHNSNSNSIDINVNIININKNF